MAKASKNIFSVIHTNIQSLMHNFDSLQYLLTDLKHKFDIVAVSETWNPKNKTVVFKPGLLEGYHTYYGQTGHTLKSGCGIYINNSLKYIERKNMDISFYDEFNEYQTKWIEVINDKKANILVCVTYRHPKNNSNASFNNYLEEKLSNIKNSNKNIILVGDFNYCLLKYEKDKYIKQFVDIMYEKFLQPCITEPSRIVNGQRPSIVDNIFTNIINKKIIDLKSI